MKNKLHKAELEANAEMLWQERLKDAWAQAGDPPSTSLVPVAADLVAQVVRRNELATKALKARLLEEDRQHKARIRKMQQEARRGQGGSK
jgi:hypothetical protein